MRHALANEGDAPLRVACWGITVVRPGGAALIPNVVPAPQPEALLPARTLALWRYSDLSDPRVAFGPRFTRLRCDPAHPAPNKLALACERGWFAYLNGGTAFVVRAPYDPAAAYPDLGCSVEVYTEGGFCEVETLGPLTDRPARREREPRGALVAGARRRGRTTGRSRRRWESTSHRERRPPTPAWSRTRSPSPTAAT